jgi:hypothetical protein
MGENVESLENLMTNLRSQQIDPMEVPYVVQYNKRDLPNAAPVEYMDFLLNDGEIQVPAFVANARNCEGVFETLNALSRILLNKFIQPSVPQINHP